MGDKSRKKRPGREAYRPGNQSHWHTVAIWGDYSACLHTETGEVRGDGDATEISAADRDAITAEVTLQLMLHGHYGYDPIDVHVRLFPVRIAKTPGV